MDRRYREIRESLQNRSFQTPHDMQIGMHASNLHI